MAKTSALWGFLRVFAMLLLLVGTAQAFDVSGSVSYTGSKTGRVYIMLNGSGGQYGTSIATTGSFTIHGVPNGSYVLSSFMDSQATGTRHATDASGIDTSGLTVSSSNLTGRNVTLTDPLVQIDPQAPGGLAAIPAENAVLVMWGTGTSSTGELADSYDLYWSTESPAGPSNTTGGDKIELIPAAGSDGSTAILTNAKFASVATGGAPLYFAIYGKINGTQSPTATTFGPVAVGNPSSSGHTVSGSVTVPENTGTTPLLIALVDSNDAMPTKFYAATIAGSVTTGETYSIANVPDGTYELHAVFDLNNNGYIDTGDLTTGNKRVLVNVSGVDVTQDLTVSDLNSEASVRTSTWTNDGTTFNYNLNFEVSGIKKRPVAVQLVTAPSYITTPVDIALSDRGGFYSWINLNSNAPQVNDSFTFNVTYSDGTSDNVTANVTAVLNSAGSFATPISPTTTGVIFDPAQAFSWSPPSISSPYFYSVSVNTQDYNSVWDTKWLPSATNFVTFNNDGRAYQPLVDNTAYNWSVSVIDMNGNAATYGKSFSFGIPAPVIASQTNYNISTGQQLTINLSASGGSSPYSWTSSNLPSWLTINSNQLLGSTGIAATYTFDVTVTGSDSQASTQTFNVTVTQPPPLAVTTAALPAATVGVYYSQQLVTGGVQPYTYDLLDGLPAGLNLSSNGLLSGTPTTASVSTVYRIDITDSAQPSSNFLPTQFPLTVNAAPSNVYFKSKVQDCSGSTCLPLQGVDVATVGLSSVITATTAADGSFTLYGIPFNTQFYITMNKTGFVQSTSSKFQLSSDTDTSTRPYSLYKQTNLTNWGNIQDNGVIQGRIVDFINPDTGYIPGATVTATDQSSAAHPVVYVEPSGAIVSGGGTRVNGRYMVLNITAGSTVTVTATAPGYTNPRARNFVVLADTVSQGRIQMDSSAPVVYGTVDYTGSKTGRIYINTGSNNGSVGTSIGSKGAFSLFGLPNGTYNLDAYMDVTGTGQKSPLSPTGSVQVTVSGTTVMGSTITLVDPTNLPTTLPAPQMMELAVGDSSVLVMPQRVQDQSTGNELADSYVVYWGNSPSVSPTSNLGIKTIAAGMDSPVVITGLTNGNTYYFTAVAKLGSSLTSPQSPVVGPVKIGARTGLNTVSGTVSLTGTPPAGALYVAIVTPSSQGMGGVFYQKIATPTFPQSFSVSGIPDGYYQVYAIVDANDDGFFGYGDVTNTEVDNAPMVDLSGSGKSGVAIALAGSNVYAELQTDHSMQNGTTNGGYGINIRFKDQLKRVVQVVLTGKPSSATNLQVPRGLGLDGHEFGLWGDPGGTPIADDQYTFLVTYSDGSSETITKTVTGVNNNFPGTVSLNNSTTTRPTFSWSAATGVSSYELYVYRQNGGNVWDNWSIPSNTTSAVYGYINHGEPLQTGQTYNWNLTARDANGNRASLNGSFTPTVVLSDSTAPSLTTSTPANSATNVPVDSILTVKFNEPVSMDGVNANTFFKTGSTYLSGAGFYDIKGDQFIFIPHAPLTAGTSYSADLTAVKDLAGNAIQTPATLSFSTGTVAPVDTTAPVTTASPAGGLFNSNQSVTLTANEAATIYYSTSGATPSTSSTQYTAPITISGTTTLKFFARDTSGNSEAVQSAIYTIDTVKPTVVSVTPASGATAVAVDSSITVVFSEDVKGSTVTTANVQVATATAAIPGTISYNQSIKSATFTPSTFMTSGTLYYISVSNVEDMAGNKVTSVNRSFTTAYPNGDFNGDGSFTIADVNKILDAALGTITPTAAEMSRADVGPLSGGKPKPDGALDVSDVVVALRKVVGLVSW